MILHKFIYLSLLVVFVQNLVIQCFQCFSRIVDLFHALPDCVNIKEAARHTSYPAFFVTVTLAPNRLNSVDSRFCTSSSTTRLLQLLKQI